jgi:hypothetical protein
MAYQSGSLKKVWRLNQAKKCRIWLLRFPIYKNGRRVEHGTIIGSLTDLPTKEEAWKEADRLGLRAFTNRDAGPKVTMTKVLAEHMSKVHGVGYDISERKWKAVKASHRAKTTTASTKSCVKN